MSNDPNSYYPGAKVSLGIRFDEFGDKSILTKKVPGATTTNLKGIKTARAGLVATAKVTDAGSNITFAADAISIGSPSQTGSGDPQVQTTSADKLTKSVGGIIPKTAEWEQASIRDGDRLKLTLRFIDCPIDPRTVRACAVQFYLGTIGSGDYADGIAGQTRGSRGAHETDGTEPLNMLANTYLDENNAQRTNLRFQGWVDEWSVDWSDKDEPTIQLTCSDNTRLFIDQQMPSGKHIDPTKPIDQAVGDFVADFPQFQGLTVVYLPAGSTIPTLGAALSETALLPKGGPPHAKGGAATEKHSIWEYLSDVCACLGLTIRVRGTQVIIQSIRNYMTATGTEGGRTDDPFQSRTVAGVTFTARRFIWGRNVSKMKTARKFFHGVPKNIEARSVISGSKTVLVARFPELKDRLAYALPGDATPDQKWDVQYVVGVKDLPTLKAMAQSYYEEQSRHELKIEVETMHLSSFGGSNEDPDLLDMKCGDSFELLVDRSHDTISSLTRIENLQSVMAAGSAFMQTLGFSADFSDAYAKAYTNAHFQTVFRAQTIAMSWNVDEGIRFKLVGINYVEIRGDNKYNQAADGTVTVAKGTPPKAGP